jgi:hypothetical protein
MNFITSRYRNTVSRGVLMQSAEWSAFVAARLSRPLLLDAAMAKALGQDGIAVVDQLVMRRMGKAVLCRHSSFSHMLRVHFAARGKPHCYYG